MIDKLINRVNLAGYGIRLMLVAAVTVSASCGDLARSGKSPSFLIIDSLTSSNGNKLDSDVQGPAGVVADVGQASLRAVLKNPGTATAPTSPTTINQVTITRYHVTFKRADGRNEPGRDVPFGFDGAVTGTVGASSSTFTFDLVRRTNKQEPPLRNLIGQGGQIQINTIAEVTFYGRDQAGNDVSVTGMISVNFADF